MKKILESPYSFWATDISSKALKVAEYNEKNILNTQEIHWIKTDLIKRGFTEDEYI